MGTSKEPNLKYKEHKAVKKKRVTKIVKIKPQVLDDTNKLKKPNKPILTELKGSKLLDQPNKRSSPFSMDNLLNIFSITRSEQRGIGSLPILRVFFPNKLLSS